MSRGDDRALAHRLDAGMAALGVTADATARERLLGYLDLMVRWNRVHNLTAVRDPLAMVDRHLLDSLAGLPWLPPGDWRIWAPGPGCRGSPSPSWRRRDRWP